MGKHVHILIADDSFSVRHAVRSLLEEMGCDIAEAPNGAQALSVLRHGNFDMLITDLQMPEMDGMALVAAVRADSRLKNIPIIMFTLQEAMQEKAFAVGVDAYICKKEQNTSERLEKTVKELLKMKEA
ncbi:response regulator [Candidatus Azambacteria bacterium]|nr:response regulator [Candidatus Azambacteria bacterium]